MFSLTSAVLTLASIGHVLGGIVSRTPEDSVLQQYNITGVDGSPYAVNIYGWDNTTSVDMADEASDLAANGCGTETVECYSTHLATNTACTALIRNLGSGISIPGSPRSICLSVSKDNQCCVSWSNKVSFAIEAYLQNAADRVVRQCIRADQSISGLTRNTQLGNTCVTQCLSNRATGCS